MTPSTWYKLTTILLIGVLKGHVDVNDALAQLIRDRYDFNGDAGAIGWS